MLKLKIAKQSAIDDWGLPFEGSIKNGVEIIRDDVIGHSRNDENHELVIKVRGKYYRAYYTVTTMEYQDAIPWVNDDYVELLEVYPAQVVTTVFRPVKD